MGSQGRAGKDCACFAPGGGPGIPAQRPALGLSPGAPLLHPRSGLRPAQPCPGTCSDGGTEVCRCPLGGAIGSLHSSCALGLPTDLSLVSLTAPEGLVPSRLRCPGGIWLGSHHPSLGKPVTPAGHPGSGRMARSGQCRPHGASLSLGACCWNHRTGWMKTGFRNFSFVLGH